MFLHPLLTVPTPFVLMLGFFLTFGSLHFQTQKFLTRITFYKHLLLLIRLVTDPFLKSTFQLTLLDLKVT